MLADREVAVLSKRVARNPLSCIALLLALMLAAGCRLQPAEEPQLAQPAVRSHPADAIEAARWLPAHTLAMASTDDLEGLADELGRRELIGRFRRQYERAVFEVVRETGWHLLSPEGLVDIGVNVAGPAAAALVVLDGEGGDRWSEQAALLTFELAEPERFKAELYRMAIRLRAGPPIVVEDAVILGESDFAVMVRGDRGFVVGSRGDARAACAELARLRPAESLAQHLPFRRALAALGTQGRVRGYLDLRGLVYAQLGLDPRWSGVSLEAAARHLERAQSDALAAARQRGASVDDIVSIDDRFGRQRQALLARGECDVRQLLGEVGGSAFAIAPHPEGIDLRMVTDLPGDALLARLLVREPAALPLEAASKPVGELRLHLEPKVLLELFDKLRPEPTDGFPAKELVASLSGSLGVTLTLPPGGFAALGGVADLGVGAVVGLADEAAAGKLMDQLASEQAGLLERQGDRYLLHAFGTVLSLSLKGGYLRLSSPGRSAPPEPAAAADPQSRPAGLVARGGGALGAYVRLGLGLLDEAPRAILSQPMEAVPWHDPAVPKSEAYRAKLAELTAVTERIAAAEARVLLERRRHFATALESVGGVGVTLWRSDSGVALEASYRTGGGRPVDVVADLVDVQPGGFHDPQQLEVERLELERSKRDAELEAIYQEDAKKYQADVPEGEPSE